MAGVGALLIIGLVYLVAVYRTGNTRGNSNNANVATTNTAVPSATLSNSNQPGLAATPNPTPSPIPVANLEGTVWNLKTTLNSRDYEDATLEFKHNGRVIEHAMKMDDGNWRYNTKGNWTRQGDKVSMDFPKDPYFDHYKYEGTIDGEKITGNIELFGVEANGTFTARLIK